MNGQEGELLQPAEKPGDSGRILLGYETEVVSNENGLSVFRNVTAE